MSHTNMQLVMIRHTFIKTSLSYKTTLVHNQDTPIYHTITCFSGYKKKCIYIYKM